MTSKAGEPWLHYLLYLNHRTYSGITTNPIRRIRQHRGEIKGGARYTTRMYPGHWNYALQVSGFATEKACRRFEFCTKHKTRCRNKKKGSSIHSRFTSWLLELGIRLRVHENVKRRVLTIIHLVHAEPEWKNKGLIIIWKDETFEKLEQEVKQKMINRLLID